MTPGKLTKDKKLSGNEKLQKSFDKRSKDLGERPATSGRRIGLKRSERVRDTRDRDSFESGDSIVYPSTAPETRRSVDVVVVDIHNEIKGSVPHLASRKLAKQRNVSGDSLPKNETSQGKNERRKGIEQGNAWEIQESIDCIKEFEETDKVFHFSDKSEPEIEVIGNSPETRSLENKSGDLNSVESIPRLFGSSEKFVTNLRENSETEGDLGDPQFIEQPKRRRKRWTKNENNLHLTQELIADSSDTNQSVEDILKSSNRQSIRPVPAPRRKKSISKSFAHDTILAFDNAAFTSDAEEVLRIETEVYEPRGTSDGSQKYTQSTKIEMRNFYDSDQKVSDEENQHPDSEDEFTGSYSGRHIQRLDKIETLKVPELIDSSDESETKDRRVKTLERHKDPRVSYKKGKSKEQSVLDTSDVSEDGEESQDRILRSDKSKSRVKKEKIISKSRESTGLDTGSSFTDTSNLPRSKSRRESFRKSSSTSKKRRDLENGKGERKRRSKQSAKRKVKNDHEIDYNINEEEKKFISITIHKADVLKTDFTTRHPMVKIHIVDMKTGNYLKIKNIDDCGGCSYLQPLITGKFDFKINRSIVPNWEEELIFEYNFQEIIQPLDKQILILFEILDLLNFAEASFNYNILGNEGCWHKIAWAFLRPVGVNGTLHINKKLRLQLYEPSKISRKSGSFSKCEVFNWWRAPSREKYPSTLYVTLKSVDPPIEEPIVYERLSLHELTELEQESIVNCRKSSDLIELPKWNRLAAQSCKIPNNHLFETEIFENGSFYLTFSNNGKYLACVGSEEGSHPILVYAIPEGKIVAQFIGHSNFIYSLNWSKNDKYLLSVSSDQTARIWDVGNKIIQHVEMLPHPSYIYCGKFHPGIKNVVITGCHDCVARVWTKSNKSSKQYELTQELYEHKGYVNSLSFQTDGGLITADSIGVIILWALKRKGGSSSAWKFRLLKIIRNDEIENVIINTISLHPLGSRLLVHSRDDGLRIIDLDTGVVLQRYKGLRNRRLQTTACLSPCGGLVLCGGEDSHLTVWNLENGKRLANYFIKDSKVIACVDYHPFDHILAFSTFGTVSAIKILNFDKNSTGADVGLSLLVDSEIEDSDDIEITMNFDKNDLLSNLNLNYSGRKSQNVSKRRDTCPERNRSYKNDDTKNENSVSKHEFLRLKIQKLNESQQNLKSRSAARLNNIIEKIDRILVNTTSKRDLDSTNSSNDTRRQDFAQVSSKPRRDSSDRSREKLVSGSWRSKSRAKGSTSNTDATMEGNNESEEFIEMKNISPVHNLTYENEESSNSHRRLFNLQSRTGTTMNISSRSDAESQGERFGYKSSGESHRRISSKENQSNEMSDIDVELNREKKSTKTKRRRRTRQPSGFLDEKPVRDSQTCVIELEDVKTGDQSNPSATSDSAGTYTIDKEKHSKNWPSDRSRATDTSGSLRSNATFTIENEISSVTRSAKR